METLLQDVRYALVSMKRNKGFTTAGLLTLALGIGATTAVFSVVYGVLWRPLPYPEPERLVRLSEEHEGAVAPLPTPMLSNITYHAWNASARTLDGFAAYRMRPATMVLPDGPARITGTGVTPSLFGLIGVSPLAGRFFRDEEGKDGAPEVIVLSHRLWRERFGSDPSVVGRVVAVDDRPHTIVGVARPGFSFPDADTLFWSALVVRPPSADATAGGRGQVLVVNALARLRPGTTLAQAETEGTAAARSTVRPMAATLLFGNGGPPIVHVRGLADEITARVRPALLVLAAGVVCVLLIACANVANMYLSRGVARQRELTVRAAIGASRGRIARQLFTESALLCVSGGALGLALAWALVRIAPALATRRFPRLDAAVIDTRVIVFAAAASLLTVLITGMLPAVRGARFNLAESLHGGDGATAGGFRGFRARRLSDALLVAEAAFAVVVLVAAMLLARSFVRLVNVDAGYTATGVLSVRVFVPGGDANERGALMNTTVASILERARAMPGVVAAGAGNMAPLDNMTLIAGFPSPWSPPGATRPRVRTVAYTVTPGYAEALGLRLKAGRLLTEQDSASGVRPWVVNEEFARLYLPPKPVGYQFTWGASSDGQLPARTMEIVGVVGNVLKGGNDTAAQPEHYTVPRLIGDDQRFYSRFEVAVKTSANPAAFASQLRAAVREVAPDAAVEIEPLSNRFAESVGEPRFAMTILATFAILALALASVGLYGVLSYSVSQRRRELGVRAALGASRGRLIALVVGEGLVVTSIGLVAGLFGAGLVTRLMQGALFGVAPLDLLSFAAAPFALVPVAIVSAALPALRAASTDPAEALRCE